MAIADANGTNTRSLLQWTLPAPATPSSSGAGGQISYDGFGNLYLCYQLNQWSKFAGILIWSMAQQMSGTNTILGLQWVLPPPPTNSSPGQVGQISYDQSGNLYLCYQPNAWAQFLGNVNWGTAQGYVYNFSLVSQSQYIPLLGGFL
jgi:hypothetical protein